MLKGMGEVRNKCVILGGGGTTVRVFRFILCKIIRFDFLEKRSRYLIVIPRIQSCIHFYLFGENLKKFWKNMKEFKQKSERILGNI